ncbi:DUF5686 and carboxypeptidase-like regulatory domain-containing protein [Halocola ammonii]
MEKRYPIYLLLVLFTSLFCLDVSAQKTVVSGVVKDKESGAPLPFVNVRFQGTKTGTTTDLDGNYRMETYYASDSLIASFIGYKPQTLPVEMDKEQVINFELSSGSVSLQEAVVDGSEKENPADRIVRRIVDNRDINNREKLDAYEYELYNKVEFDLNNITEEFQNRKIFKPFDFVFNNIDTTEEKAYLPIFMTETISNFYYRRSPKTEKEVIHGTKVSGIENNSVSQFLGDMYQNVNIYENNIIVFGKSFVSPISSYAFTFYEYTLQDSAFIDDKWCYLIEFEPKRIQEPVFTGEFWVNDTTYAIKDVEAQIAENANINFINGFKVRQQYEEVEDEVWMLKKDHLLVDFNLAEKTMGFYGRKTTTYRDFTINEPRDPEFYKGLTDVVVADDANEKDEEFWEEKRHEKLSESEKEVYAMVDTMKTVPQFKTIADLITLFVTGYKEVGLFEIGPYYTLYSFNPIEGNRFRFGGRTSNKFSTRLMINAYGAYGLKDERFKYGGGFLYMLSKKPRQLVSVQARKDVEQLGQGQNAFQQGNVLSSVFRRNPATKLTNLEEYELFYEREWFYGLSNKIIFQHRIMRPLGTLLYRRYNAEGEITDVPQLTTSEVSLYTRFAYKEKFVSGEFERVSLGTKYPVLEFQYSYGMPDVLGSDYEYHKLRGTVSDKIRFGPLGYLKLQLEAGKVWGKLPFPLLVLHQGNETFFYDESAFNTMNFFEFVSDRYASAFATYHLEGLFLNKIPLVRRLKWREVVSARAVIGDFDEENLEEMVLPANTYTLSKPFVEAAVGVENILKVLRIDFLYRLSYLDHDDIVRFGIRAKLQIDF